MSNRWRSQFSLLPPNREGVGRYAGLLKGIGGASVSWVTCEKSCGMLGLIPYCHARKFVCDKKNHMVEIKLKLTTQCQRIRYGGN